MTEANWMNIPGRQRHCTGIRRNTRTTMIGSVKRKAIFGALVVLDAALLGTAVTLVSRIFKKKAQEEVVDAIIKENEANIINSDTYGSEDATDGSEKYDGLGE